MYKHCGNCGQALSVADAYEKGYTNLSPDDYANDSRMSANSWYCKIEDGFKKGSDVCASWESFKKKY